MNSVINILVAGTGGQGVMTAADIIARAAILAGQDVKKTEVAGMAQRGGVVTSHVRFGKQVYSPSITPGSADLLLAFEPAEALRWVDYLHEGATALVNTVAQVPPVVSIGLFNYPDAPLEQLAQEPIHSHALEAGRLASRMGDYRLVNSIMLGATANYLPFASDLLKQALLEHFAHKGDRVVALNAQAFDAGTQAIRSTAQNGEKSETGSGN